MIEPLYKPNPVGRPTKMTPETVKKLEEAFAIGASDGEACFYADISKETLYTYQDKTPGFLDRKNALKERPVLLARQTVAKSMETDVNTAKWYLERKLKKEFASRNELTGADGKDLPTPLLGGVSKNTTPDTNDDIKDADETN
jgi:hypothetical protein